MPYPIYRPRRLRESPLVRKMVRETTLRADHLMSPLFVLHGRSVREPIIVFSKEVSPDSAGESDL